MNVLHLSVWLVIGVLSASLTACSEDSGSHLESAQRDSPGDDPQENRQSVCRSFCDVEFWAGARAFDVEIRLNASGEPNAQSKSGASPLHYAALSAFDAEAVQALIDAGAEIEAREPSRGFTPLFYAAWSSNRVAMKVLLENGADVTATAEAGLTALHVAVQFAKDPPQFLISSDSTREQVEAWRKVKSEWEERFPSTIHLLLEYGADPDALSDAGDSACLLANDWVRQSEILSEICPRS